MQNTISKKSAFTIVELLIVIVVIAILAAITIVAYNGIQDRARSSNAASAATQAKKQLEIYKINNNELYPTSLSSAGIADSGNITYQYRQTSSGTGFCLTATDGNKSYKTSNTENSSPGGCAGHGQGGISAITNLATNPAAVGYTTTQAQLGWRQDRYVGSGTYASVSGANDGPIPQITTYNRYTFTQAVGSDRGFHLVGNTQAASPSSNGYPVAEGETYTVSAYIRSSDGQGDATTTIRFSDGTNWSSGTVSGSPVSLSGGNWARAFVSATAPAGAVKMHSIIRQTGSVPTHSIGDTIDGTGLMVTESSSNYGYADGSSPDWIWNGSAYNSTSTGPPL